MSTSLTLTVPLASLRASVVLIAASWDRVRASASGVPVRRRTSGTPWPVARSRAETRRGRGADGVRGGRRCREAPRGPGSDRGASRAGPRRGHGGYCWCHLSYWSEGSQGVVCTRVPFLTLGVDRQSPLDTFCQTSYQPEGGPSGLSAKKTRHCWVVAAASQNCTVTVPAPEAGAVMHRPVFELVKVNRPVWVLNPSSHLCSEPPVHDHIWSFAAFSVALSRQWLEFQTLIGVNPAACAGAPATAMASIASAAVTSASMLRRLDMGLLR